MMFETYQVMVAQTAIDNCFPAGEYDDDFRDIEADILAYHGTYPDRGAMTQQQLGEVLAPFHTEAVQMWVLTCIEHADCYQMTPQRCIS
jgi:hypothetical protein